MRSKKKTIFMGSTDISCEETVGQIQRILGNSGASQILLDYKDGDVSAVSFKYEVNHTSIPFHLPCRWQKIHKFMMDQMSNPRQSRMAEYERQSKRVAWRQILRWIEAQMALVDTEMVKIEEIFMPYMQSKSGQTLFDHVAAGNFKMLELK